MKTLTNPIVWILLLIVNTSCNDIFEPSIEDKEVSIIAPADSAASPVYKVLFWWNPLEDALRYNIQVVAPNFNSITDLVLDTTVSTTKFSYTLVPGKYQWRIRAENGSTQTAYITRTLTVDTTSIVEQPVDVLTPDNNKYFKSDVTFTWAKLYGASYYQIEIDTFPGNFNSSGNYKVNTTTTNPWYTYDFKNDGVFKWRVKAVSSSMENSKYSDARTVYIDQTPPSSVTVLRSSASGTNMVLSWDPPVSTDINSYKVYIQKVGVGTDTSSYATISPYPAEISSGTSYSFTGGLAGEKFVWRVVAVDKALNESSFSLYKGFTK